MNFCSLTTKKRLLPLRVPSVLWSSPMMPLITASKLSTAQPAMSFSPLLLSRWDPPSYGHGHHVRHVDQASVLTLSSVKLLGRDLGSSISSNYVTCHLSWLLIDLRRTEIWDPAQQPSPCSASVGHWWGQDGFEIAQPTGLVGNLCSVIPWACWSLESCVPECNFIFRKHIREHKSLTAIFLLESL